MSFFWVALCYGAAAALALLLLYRFEPIRWFWHVLGVAAAIAVGLAHLPAPWNTPRGTLAVGSLFLLLFLWGSLFPLFRTFHHHPRTSD
jgi:hypothetical protein